MKSAGDNPDRIVQGFPQPTCDLDTARNDIDRWGYCLLAKVFNLNELTSVRQRLREQVAGEARLGIKNLYPDGKQLVLFLLNKGQVFRDMALNPALHGVVSHVLGERYLLSSCVGHLAHPGGITDFHTDQWWMPKPGQRPGEFTRKKNRGRWNVEQSGKRLDAISPPVVCNSMLMLDDFTESNGATLLVPGSHRRGREPDNETDGSEDWIPVVAPAGTVLVFEGRIWHSTGVNTTQESRVGIAVNFCGPQFRPQENYLVGLDRKVLDSSPPKLLELIGLRTWELYGGLGDNEEWLDREHQSLGELTSD